MEFEFPIVHLPHDCTPQSAIMYVSHSTSCWSWEQELEVNDVIDDNMRPKKVMKKQTDMYLRID
jgi:hypothetical protein